MAELEGKTLDRYELRRLIGKGGMANVYEAYDPNFHRVVAVKVFKREDEEMLRRFIREAQLMSKLHHPRLVQIYDSGDCLLDGITRYYIVLPLLAGGTLRAYIRRSPLSLSTICRCLRDIARALDYIHSEHIIHRDIKASNVLLDDEGQCFLTDFGIARITTDATQLTSTGNVLGTADYVAPELFEVHRRADARSDLYSLGVLLYEMVTGRLPFTADNQLALISMQVSKTAPSPRQFVPQLPSQVERVMYKALEKNPDLRYASAIELADSFCRAASQPASDVVEQVSRSNMARANLAATAIKTETEASRDRPSPLASATEGFSYTTPPRVQPPGSLSPDTPVLPSSARIRRKNVVGKRPAFTVILGLLILLVLAIPLAYAAFNRSASKQNTITQNTATTSSQSPISGQSSTTPDAAQTTQIAATATAAAKVQATASAIAAATATARAQATATVGPIATATGGQPIYADPLDNANSPATQEANWDQNNQCMFASDGYHVLQPASVPYFKGCREQSNTYANLALSVNMIILTGHSGGVFFRLSTNLIGNYDGYLFEVDTRGNYKFSREQGSSVIPIQDWRSSPALRTGYNVKNVLQLIARGDTFLFYANGRFLMQARDTYSNQANTIGLLATSENGGSDAEVVYNTLKVYALT